MPRDRSREREERSERHRHQRRRRSRSPPSKEKRKKRDAEDESDSDGERQQRLRERLAKWKKKQGVEGESRCDQMTPPTEGVDDDAQRQPSVPQPEMDALDAFMAAEVIPEVSAAAHEAQKQKEEEKFARVKSLAAGKATKRPKFLDESDSEDEANLEVEIPTNKVKLVVGPSGTKIGDIQKKSKCRIQIQKKPEDLNRAFGSGPEPAKPRGGSSKGMTTLLIYGDPKGVAVAKRLIEEAVENKEQKRQQRQREYEKKRSAKNRDRQIYHLRHARDYDTLGLPLGASKTEAKKAYRKLAVQFHPDKYTGSDKEAAQKRFLEIQRAYQSLMSSDEDQRIEQLVRIVSCHGVVPQETTRPRPSAVYVCACVCDDGEVIGASERTRYYDRSQTHCEIDENLTFCVKFRDLPETAQLGFTVYELGEAKGERLLGGATMRLFNKRGKLKTALHHLRLWIGKPPDLKFPSSTPGKRPLAERGEFGRLENLMKKYSRGDIPKLEWLDRMAFKRIERLQSELGREDQSLKLTIKLPMFHHAVLYQSSPVDTKAKVTTKSVIETKDPLENLVTVPDPEIGLENPIDNKAQKLARNFRRGRIDMDLKPNGEERKRLTAVLKLPPNKTIATHDKALLWQFRGTLISEKAALTKFLKSVDWSDAREARESEELMEKWAPIDIADALELLSPDFKNQGVRAHAVKVLERADDDELLCYLLQLVQALRYEVEDNSQLAMFLASRAAANPRLGFFFHWYLFTERNDSEFGNRVGKVHNLFKQKLEAMPHGEIVWEFLRRQDEMVAQLTHLCKEMHGAKWRDRNKVEHLHKLLSDQGLCAELMSLRVPLPIAPSILLTGIVPQECTVFKSKLSPLKLTFKAEPNSLDLFFMRTPGTPGTPSVMNPTESLGKQSQALPYCIQDNNRCVLIFKKGDDLRQDQFTVAMFDLMDRLLKKENLDLMLTIYQVLPTSSDSGFVEFVNSKALAQILAQHRTILKFLALHHPDPSNVPYGIEKQTLQTFVRSCAGYCVMTYILGVGDRHLDNLMLTTSGRLFHIDFGYILGRDPKPFPPPMKICNEMVEAMGTTSSSHYEDFVKYCCEAYNIIRKNSNLVLSLFHLMAGSSIPDISMDPEKAMLKIQERLELDLDDGMAVQKMKHLINESANALMPQIMETTHRWAQYWK